MYANSWTELISTKGLKKTSNRGKEKLRLSLKRGGILGRIGITTTITSLGMTLLGS